MDVPFLLLLQGYMSFLFSFGLNSHPFLGLFLFPLGSVLCFLSGCQVTPMFLEITVYSQLRVKVRVCDSR